MIYLGVAIVLGVVALIVALLSLRLLIGHWILAWLRGTAGLALIGCAILLGFAAWDLHNYQQVPPAGRAIATLAFNKIDDKEFNVNLVDQAGNEQHYQLSGDLWQIDVHLLKWIDTLEKIGVQTGYRFDRLSGRYLALEDEQRLPHIVLELHAERTVFDVWFWLHNVNRYFSLIEAQDASVNYLPMADGALYSVSIDRAGLAAQPLNERAKLAMEQWQ